MLSGQKTGVKKSTPDSEPCERALMHKYRRTAELRSSFMVIEPPSVTINARAVKRKPDGFKS